jgi:hypothetical protein
MQNNKKIMKTALIFILSMAACSGCVYMKDTNYPMQDNEIEFYESLNDSRFQVDSMMRIIYKSVWTKDHKYYLELHPANSESLSDCVIKEKLDEIALFVSKMTINDKRVVTEISIYVSRGPLEYGVPAPQESFRYEIKANRNDRLWRLIPDR